MKLVIFGMSKKLLAGFSQMSWIQSELCSIPDMKNFKAGVEDLMYLDVSSLSAEEVKKQLSLLKKLAAGSFWGIIDPKGSIEDPARLFFDGASDYLGPAMCIKGFDRNRLKIMLNWNPEKARAVAQADPKNDTASFKSVAVTKAAAATKDAFFPGWNDIKTGKTYHFYYLYLSVSAHTNLKTRLGEAAYKAFRDKTRLLLQQSLTDADSILWMESNDSYLFLIPPKTHNASTAIVACLRLILFAPLLTYEKLSLPFPLNFTFALHYGQSEYAPPGKTGTIISDAVNFIHHLGAKKAEPGRISISEDAAHLLSDKRLEYFFANAGCFEKRNILHSKRFE